MKFNASSVLKKLITEQKKILKISLG